MMGGVREPWHHMWDDTPRSAWQAMWRECFRARYHADCLRADAEWRRRWLA